MCILGEIPISPLMVSPCFCLKNREATLFTNLFSSNTWLFCFQMLWRPGYTVTSHSEHWVLTQCNSATVKPKEVRSPQAKVIPPAHTCHKFWGHKASCFTTTFLFFICFIVFFFYIFNRIFTLLNLKFLCLLPPHKHTSYTHPILFIFLFMHFFSF